MNRFKHLYIYMLSDKVDYNSILTYLTSMINCNVECRGEDALYRGLDRHCIAEMYASCRIKDIFKDINSNNYTTHVSEDDVEYELSILNGAPSKPIVYDGFRLQYLYSNMIDANESSLDNVHVIITDRLLATYNEEDMRYHLNTIVLGYPSIVSIDGIVEAPAKPKAFYTLYYYHISQGRKISMDEVKSIFKDEILEHDDPRLTDAAKGYIMQALFYNMLNDVPFCDDKRCMLYNAHWQDEVIEAQIRHGRLCSKHREMLDEFNKKYASS
ncbi:MAG: hypothetical protein QW450_05085 [Candidatus Nitrosocaldus sp.]